MTHPTQPVWGLPSVRMACSRACAGTRSAKMELYCARTGSVKAALSRPAWLSMRVRYTRVRRGLRTALRVCLVRRYLMRISQLLKNMLKYLPVLAILLATVIGLFLGKNLYPASLDSQSKTPAQLSTEPNNLQPLIVPGAMGPCGFSNIYTSLPPKCRTLDGKFIPLPGTSNLFVIPQGK